MTHLGTGDGGQRIQAKLQATGKEGPFAQDTTLSPPLVACVVTSFSPSWPGLPVAQAASDPIPVWTAGARMAGGVPAVLSLSSAELCSHPCPGPVLLLLKTWEKKQW